MAIVSRRGGRLLREQQTAFSAFLTQAFWAASDQRRGRQREEGAVHRLLRWCGLRLDHEALERDGRVALGRWAKECLRPPLRKLSKARPDRVSSIPVSLGFEPCAAYEGFVECRARELGKPLHDGEGADEGGEHRVRELGGKLERATPGRCR